jgi:dUTP pyrophosphatase
LIGGTYYMDSIKIKKLNDYAMTPTRGDDNAAGYDLYAYLDETMTIEPHETRKIGTGIAMEIPTGYFGGVFARSGIATKRGLRPANAVGVVDSSYRGEIIVALHNDTDYPQTIEPYERVAQLIIIPYLAPTLVEANELSKTKRGTGGFGSTGR